MPSHTPNRLTSQSVFPPPVSASRGGTRDSLPSHPSPPLRGDGETVRRSQRVGLPRRSELDQEEHERAFPLAPLLTATEVAELLRLHAKTVERWARRGRLPCYRIGGRVLFARGDIATFLAERRTD